MYTPNQVSDMLQIPSSSLRRYSTVFKDYLTIKHSKGQKRTYTEQDIVTLGKIRDLAKSGLNQDQIMERLPLIEDQTEPLDNALSLIPTVAKELQDLKDFKAAVKIKIEKLEGELKESNDKNIELEQRLNELEYYNRLPWYKKLNNKPRSQK